MKFQGKIAEIPGEGVEGIALRVTRADHVIALSLLVMVLMMSLAMGVLLMALRVLTSDGALTCCPSRSRLLSSSACRHFATSSQASPLSASPGIIFPSSGRRISLGFPQS